MNLPTRRRFLTTGVALAGATAGCLGGASDSDPESSPAEDTQTPAPGQPLPTPVQGDPEADVTVAAYEDYACPHCATYSTDVYPEIDETYISENTIRYEFHDLPIPVDETVSWQAASAARAVQDHAGDDAYFTYSKRLFENQSRLAPDVYAELTDGLDVDGEVVKDAATGDRYRQTVEADRSAGIERGVEGTPALFVNDEPVQWQEIAFEPVRDAIEAARSE